MINSKWLVLREEILKSYRDYYAINLVDQRLYVREEAFNQLSRAKRNVETLDKIFNRVKKPKTSYCPYDGCNSGLDPYNIAIELTCSCGERSPAYRKCCSDCGHCLYCDRILKSIVTKSWQYPQYKKKI